MIETVQPQFPKRWTCVDIPRVKALHTVLERQKHDLRSLKNLSMRRDMSESKKQKQQRVAILLAVTPALPQYINPTEIRIMKQNIIYPALCSS